MEKAVLKSDLLIAIGYSVSLKSESEELASAPYMEVDGTNHGGKDACNSGYGAMIDLLDSYKSAVDRDADIIQKIADNLNDLDTDMKIDMEAFYRFSPKE